MAWELSSWLALLRTFQIFGAVACGGLNGFLVAWIYTSRLGLSHNMVILELLICILLVYTTLALTVQHSGKRSRSTPWLTVFILGDTLHVGMIIGIITILTRAGVPCNCAGLTTTVYDHDDPSQPDHGYTTVRFSDEAGGHKGELDKFCAFERSYYFIIIGMILTFIATIVFTVLRIADKYYAKKREELLNSLHRARGSDEEKALALHGGNSRASLLLGPELPPFPPSEGVISRATSVRSTMTAAANSSQHQGMHSMSMSSPYSQRANDVAYPAGVPPLPLRRLSSGTISRRPLPPSATTTTTTATLMSTSSSPASIPATASTSAAGYTSLTPLTPLTPGFVSVTLSGSTGPASGLGISSPISGSSIVGVGFVGPEGEGEDEDEDDAAAALVSDGMQHQHPPLTPICPHRTRQQQRERMHMLPEEEQTAESALVSDGMRSVDVLPPYEPGNARMFGHGAEDNEMRLSEYVKGQTRAQDMKDSGGY